MAPRRRWPKVGLTRMHAALDAMRPMGFSSDVVRKCVKTLLKVYGDDGWAFIEEAAYKLLIDTILEEPAEVDRLENKPEHLLLEGGSHGRDEKPELVHELCDKEVILEERVCAYDIHKPETQCKEINVKREKKQKHDLDVEVTPMLLQDVNTRPEVGVQCGFAISCTPQPSDSNPENRACKPCYGWISDDDEDDDFLHLNPAERVENESLSNLAA